MEGKGRANLQCIISPVLSVLDPLVSYLAPVEKTIIDLKMMEWEFWLRHPLKHVLLRRLLVILVRLAKSIVPCPPASLDDGLDLVKAY